ncbi:MAG: DNA-directed RNA polymerase subunit omega [Acidimicrobiaceae bacterium]|nr:DNA-directed RNA polymerase subunit omega [Acidimicrobiaceae bacterium]
MAHGYDTMMTPAIEELLDRTESKFVLVTLAAMRSREITNYLGQLAGGIGATIPPQVISTSSKPLSIALEEIAAGKIEAVDVDPDAEDTEADAADLLTHQGDAAEGAHLLDVSDPGQALTAAESSESAGDVGA